MQCPKTLTLVRVPFGKEFTPKEQREYNILGVRGPVGFVSEIKKWIEDNKLPVEKLQIVDKISDNYEVIKLWKLLK